MAYIIQKTPYAAPFLRSGILLCFADAFSLFYDFSAQKTEAIIHGRRFSAHPRFCLLGEFFAVFITDCLIIRSGQILPHGVIFFENRRAVFLYENMRCILLYLSILYTLDLYTPDLYTPLYLYILLICPSRYIVYTAHTTNAG